LPIEFDVSPEQLVIDARVGRVGFDDLLDGDHLAGSLVEVGIDPRPTAAAIAEPSAQASASRASWTGFLRMSA
jgi:hypothetical protein